MTSGGRRDGRLTERPSSLQGPGYGPTWELGKAPAPLFYLPSPQRLPNAYTDLADFSLISKAAGASVSNVILGL